jgi:hypothetical protein
VGAGGVEAVGDAHGGPAPVRIVLPAAWELAADPAVVEGRGVGVGGGSKPGFSRRLVPGGKGGVLASTGRGSRGASA